MPPFRSVVFILFFVLSLAAHAWAESRVLARADVPNASFKQGEVRLLLQDGNTIVRTILHTRFQNLVKKQIVGKEKKNWPGSLEAVDYLAALEQAFEHYAARRREEDGPIGLLIDFVDGADADRVDFSFASVARGKDGFRVEQAVLWRTLRFSNDYVRRNQEHILVDVFGSEATAVLDTLRDLRSNQVGGVHE